MKKAVLYSILSLITFSVVSCAISNGVTADDVANGRTRCESCEGTYSPTDISVAVKKETRKMLQSPVVTMAGAQMDKYTYYLVLKENKTFSTVVNIHGTKQYDFRAGTFQTEGDTLKLSYYKNLCSAHLTDRVLVDNKKSEMYFLNASMVKTTRLKILNEL